MTSANSILSEKVAFITSQLTERPDVGVYVEHLPGYVVHNADDMDSLMALGQKNREQTIQDSPWRQFFLLSLIFYFILGFLSFFLSFLIRGRWHHEHE